MTRAGGSATTMWIYPATIGTNNPCLTSSHPLSPAITPFHFFSTYSQTLLIGVKGKFACRSWKEGSNLIKSFLASSSPFLATFQLCSTRSSQLFSIILNLLSTSPQPLSNLFPTSSQALPNATSSQPLLDLL